MFVPVDAVAPVIPDWVTVHEYVVPETPPVKAILVAFPEQKDCELGVAVGAVGNGLTVGVTPAVIGQPLTVAVAV